jgi:drug/metabolite transporter (DMT)-like permease
MSAPSPLRVLLLTGVLCLVWGSTWVVIQEGLEDLPPFGSAAARYTLAAVGMAIVTAALSRREGGAPPGWRLTAVLGTLNFAASYGIVYWSETRLPSGLVAVLWAAYPMLQAVAGHLFLPEERVGAGQLAGFVVGFLGVAALFATDLRTIGPGAIPAGAVLLLSPVISAVGTTYVKKHGAGTSSLRLNRNAMCLGTVLLWAASLATEREARVVVTGTAVASVLYLALFGTVLTFGLYFWLLRHTAANRLSVIAYVTPGIALLLGWLVRDEALGAARLLGLAGILGGVYLVHRGAPGRKARYRVEDRPEPEAT